ncbi:lengsin-like isoform X1 [Anneissia japonica]|uniref:lengsin-like isoform X1 n=1 Tax=Anneissia japonica TaxID=1529436 RepID=UPI0014257AEF|nr:lengsin-like isoform X1 [Anneissia japonica]
MVNRRSGIMNLKIIEKLLSRIRDANIKFVRFEVVDMFGISRLKLIPARHFKSKAENGMNFHVSYLGSKSLGNMLTGTGCTEELHYSDAVMFPVLDTFEVLPWWNDTARILIEPSYDGNEVSFAPRFLARQQLTKLKKMGYSLLSAHEHEFYVVNKDTMKPLINDSNIRSTIRLYESAGFIHQLGEDLPKVGIDIECMETEAGPGQHEISYKPSFGIKAADTAFTYRGAVKEIAMQHGLMASFMSKPYPDKNGSSCHFCHSLWDVEGNIPLIFDDDSPDKLSNVAKYWIAGVIHHAPALSLFMGPTVNCRKRYKPFSFAPSNATWGFDNRTCAVRVKINSEFGSYIENRMGSAGSNPYLVLAATVAAGIDGIKKKLSLPADVTGSAYLLQDVPEKTPTIPTSMQDAVEAFLQDEVIRDAFGEDFVKCFVAIKSHEMQKAREADENGDSMWDWNMYFKYI